MAFPVRKSVLVATLVAAVAVPAAASADPLMRTRIDLNVERGPEAVASGDFNADGNVDIAVASHYKSSASGLSVLLGNGLGAFEKSIPYNTGGSYDILV